MLRGFFLQSDGICFSFGMFGYVLLFDKTEFSESFIGYEKEELQTNLQDIIDALSNVFCGLTLSEPEEFHTCFFDIYHTIDGLFAENLIFCAPNKSISDKCFQCHRKLPNLNDLVIIYEHHQSNRKIAMLECNYPHDMEQKWWICEVHFVNEDKKGWFYMQNETHVAWAIMMVFAYKDKKELRIEIDEKTGEILDVFMFSPIEGITL